MGLGTVAAASIVANLPKAGGSPSQLDSPDQKPLPTPAWRKDISETFATDDFDYLRKLERHQHVPQHWPFPPPAATTADDEFD